MYARRWEIELIFDEIKTHQRERPVLRSQTLDGVRQEIYAHLIVHHASGNLLNEAARLHQSVAEQTSFTRALNVVRRTVIAPGGFSPSARRRDRRLACTEIGRSLLLAVTGRPLGEKVAERVGAVCRVHPPQRLLRGGLGRGTGLHAGVGPGEQWSVGDGGKAVGEPWSLELMGELGQQGG
ncbi:hypothetical protein GTZ78_22670 [Streptomyces sp. SID8361]|nr:hypothetical protein [Streptomyces sp. SID8361]